MISMRENARSYTAPRGIRRDHEKNWSTPTFMLCAGGHRLQRPLIRLPVGLVEDQADLVHAGVEESLHLFATLPRAADDRHGIDHLVGDQSGGLVLLAGLIGLADAVGLGAEADPMHVLVVE